MENYKRMKVSTLKNLAKERGILGYSRLRSFEEDFFKNRILFTQSPCWRKYWISNVFKPKVYKIDFLKEKLKPFYYMCLAH